MCSYPVYGNRRNTVIGEKRKKKKIPQNSKPTDRKTKNLNLHPVEPDFKHRCVPKIFRLCPDGQQNTGRACTYFFFPWIPIKIQISLKKRGKKQKKKGK